MGLMTELGDPALLESIAAALGVPADALDEQDIADFQRKQEDAKRERIEKIGQSVQKRIDEAIKARDGSGIERRWRADLLQYYGEDVNDDASNMTERAADGTVRSNSGQRQTKSRVIVNITRPKANAVMSRLGDMLLPTDDKNWGIQPTPDPELNDLSKSTKQALNEMGEPVMNASTGKPATAAEAVKSVMDSAVKAAEAMSREIEDNHVECDYNGELRKGIWFASVLGTMVLKGPVAMTRVSNSWQKQGASWAMTRQMKIVPGSKNVDPRNFFPDPSCDGDIKKARYVVEKELFNDKTLRELRGQEGFIDQAIVECLEEGPKASIQRGQSMDRRYISGEYQPSDGNYYDVYHVYGQWSKGELEELGVEGCECEDESDRQEAVSGCVVQCNGRPIKAYLNPLDTGEIPYDVFVYEKVAGQVFGVGVPYILRNPQRVVTAAWRMVLDNAALASGGQIVLNQKVIRPADNVWEIRGSKLWYANEELGDVRQAFATFQFDTRMEELLKIIEMAMRFAEDESSMPALLEGQQGSAPETVGGMTMLMNNANAVLRRLVKTFDDNITDPHVTRYYDWHMQYNEDESIKGDFQIDARGSSVLLVRDIQKQSLLQIGQYVSAPPFSQFHKRGGYDYLRTMYEANHIQPDSVLVDEQEADQIFENMKNAPPPKPPQVEVAEMRVQAEMEDADRERQYDMQRAQAEQEFEKFRMQHEQNMAVLEYAKERQITLMQAKKELAALTIKENAATARQSRELEAKFRFGTGI